MLKFLFWALLGLNAVMLAYGQGLLGSFKASEREPQRIRNQLNTSELKLLSAEAALRMQPPAPAPAAEPEAAPEPASEPQAASAEPAGAALACTEVGKFADAEARRFEKLLAPLDLGKRLTQDSVSVQETTQHMVLIPPSASKDAADAKAAELKAQGVSNYFIMNEAGALKWAISLGVFKSEASAQTLLASLKKQGVTGAKIVGRTSNVTRTVFRLRGLDKPARAKVDSAVAKFAGVEARNCK